MSTEVAPVAQPQPASSTPEIGPYQTATHKGISVTSNTDSAENMQATLAFDEKAEESADQGSAPPSKDTEAKPDAKAKAPAKADAPGGPERGPDGRWLPKEPKEDAQAAKGEQDDTEPEPKKKGNPRHDPIARMEEVTREAAALKRDLAIARQELAAARQTPRPQPAPQAFQPPPPDAQAPKEEDFKTYADFVDARAAYRANQAIEARIARMSQQAQAQARADQYTQGVNTAVGRYQTKVGEAIKADPSMREVIETVAAQITPTIGIEDGRRPGPLNVLGDEVLASENPVEILRYLHENPDTLQRVATLRTSREVAREVAKIEARIEAQSKAEAAAPAGTAPRPVSQAPRPVRPVTGGRTTADSAEPDDSMSDAEYFRRRMAQGVRRAR